MSSHKYAKAKGRRAKNQFLLLRFDMIDSPAWLSLSTNAQALWLHIRRRYNGYNNGEISYSCREAANKLNVSPNTASRNFKELQEKGFIKIALFAGFQNKHRTASRWIMTHEPYKNKAPTNEWRKWSKSAPT